MADGTLTAVFHQVGPIPLDVSLACGPGQVLAVFGPSGSGKTTILRSIAGLYRPARAEVRAGSDVWTDTARGVAVAPHRRAVGLVFQEYALFPHLTALGNVAMALGHWPARQRATRARDLLRLVHLDEHADRRPSGLSGGERQRVALARALARDPAVLLLDEPFAAVDRAIRRRLRDEVDEVRRQLDIPVVLVTHDVDDVLRLASDLLVLERGRAVASGSLTDLTSRPDLAWLREGLGLGSVFDAVVGRVDTARGLVELAFDGGTLLAAEPSLSTGMRVRLRIPAREVVLARDAPEGLSLHNALEGTVSAMSVDPATDHAIVQLTVGAVRLLAEVTRDAVSRLDITSGRRLFALVKSVSLDLRVVREPAARHERAER